MALILGIVASGNYPRVTNSYESIATTTVGAGGSSTITFSSIPSTYKHLQLRYIAANANGGAYSDAFNTARFNSDTGANYVSHYVLGDGASAAAGNTGASQTSCWFGVRVTGGSSIFQANIVDILDYTSTNKNKTIRVLSGSDRNGSGVIVLQSTLWMNSSTAISTIDISGTFTQYSSFALYGIKG